MMHMKEKIKSKLVYAIIIITLIFIGINIDKIRRLESYEQDILAEGYINNVFGMARNAEYLLKETEIHWYYDRVLIHLSQTAIDFYESLEEEQQEKEKEWKQFFSQLEEKAREISPEMQEEASLEEIKEYIAGEMGIEKQQLNQLCDLFYQEGNYSLQMLEEKFGEDFRTNNYTRKECKQVEEIVYDYMQKMLKGYHSILQQS